MIEIRQEIEKRLSPVVLERIRLAPKPTKVAEALAVAKELPGVSVGLNEVAEIINIADPGRDVKAKPSDYATNELDRHPDLVITITPRGSFVRYVGGRSIYSK
jgi:hypothetical protein